MTDTDNERPMTHPERLRAIADWLDLTDPIVAAYMRTQPESPEREEALACVEGKEMQADLRNLADDMEGNPVTSPGDWVDVFYMVPEWNPGGREAYLEQRQRLGIEKPKKS